LKLSGPKLLLHLEGLSVLVAACLANHAGGFAWWKFGTCRRCVRQIKTFGNKPRI